MIVVDSMKEESLLHSSCMVPMLGTIQEVPGQAILNRMTGLKEFYIMFYPVPLKP